jgi:hypothetical protein
MKVRQAGYGEEGTIVAKAKEGAGRCLKGTGSEPHAAGSKEKGSEE